MSEAADCKKLASITGAMTGIAAAYAPPPRTAIASASNSDNPSPTNRNAARVRVKIGRASCRERVEVTGGAEQAEDGIRDWSVTGVQTCALPISMADVEAGVHERGRRLQETGEHHGGDDWDRRGIRSSAQNGDCLGFK